MLRRVATFCRQLRPVLLLVSFPRSRSPVVGVLGLCWMWHGVPFACQRRPIVGVLRVCWLLPGSFDCFCCPHTSVHRPSIACLAVFLCGPGALFLHALSGPSTICPFSPHGWSAPDGLPLLLRKQPIWAAGDTPHLMPVEQGLPWHPPPPSPPRLLAGPQIGGDTTVHTTAALAAVPLQMAVAQGLPHPAMPVKKRGDTVEEERLHDVPQGRTVVHDVQQLQRPEPRVLQGQGRGDQGPHALPEPPIRQQIWDQGTSKSGRAPPKARSMPPPPAHPCARPRDSFCAYPQAVQNGGFWHDAIV